MTGFVCDMRPNEQLLRNQLATRSAYLGVALLFGTAVFHLAAYRSVVSGAPAEIQPIVAAAWVAGGVSLVLSALLAIAATPLFITRRATFLTIAALTPLSIAVLQVVYLGFIPPTGLLLLDAACLFAAGLWGRPRGHTVVGAT